MTALKEFDRLESGGLWRAGPDAQRRDVTVSFGNATLVIADGAGRPLTHWSLPALIRTNPGDFPAIYAPDSDESETLEISDDLMVGAIEKVRKSLDKLRPQTGKLRHLTTAAIAVGITAAVVFWLPGALTRQTLTVVPLFKRSEIGATILGHYQRLTGPTCRGAAGTQALTRLITRLLGPDAAGQIVVVQTLPQGALMLPGGIILIDRAIVEQNDDVAVPAGYIVAASTDRNRNDPLADVLSLAGLKATLQLLTTGDLPNESLVEYATLIRDAPSNPSHNSNMISGFDAALLPITPFAMALDPATAEGLIAQDPMQGREVPIILTDRDWVALQNICTT